ncbi:MAG: hypothetical protein ABIZ36_05120 [Gemmatimonadaceae bacterium]
MAQDRLEIVIWTRYLYRMSRLNLVLVASHPDRTAPSRKTSALAQDPTQASREHGAT